MLQDGDKIALGAVNKTDDLIATVSGDEVIFTVGGVVQTVKKVADLSDAQVARMTSLRDEQKGWAIGTLTVGR